MAQTSQMCPWLHQWHQPWKLWPRVAVSEASPLAASPHAALLLPAHVSEQVHLQVARTHRQAGVSMKKRLSLNTNRPLRS